MENNETNVSKKDKVLKALKYAGIGIGGVALTILGIKYIKSDNGPSEETKKLVDELNKQIAKEKETEYSRGYDDSILDMISWCQEHGKSIVATSSSKGYGEENAECWLVAETFDTKPDLPDILVDYPYTIKTPKK